MSQAKFSKNDRVVRTERIGSGESLKELKAAGRVTAVDRNGVEIAFDDPKMGKSWVPNRLVKLEIDVLVAKVAGTDKTVGVPAPLRVTPKGGQPGAMLPVPLVNGKTVYENLAARTPPAPAIMERPPAPKTYGEMHDTAVTTLTSHLSEVQDEITALQEMAKGLITKAEHALADAKKERERKRVEVNDAQAALVEAEKFVEVMEKKLRSVMQYAGPR